MKIGKFSVKPTYKLARIVCDFFSAVIAVPIFLVSADFTRLIGNSPDPGQTFRETWFMLIFPAAVVGIFAAYLILTTKDRGFKKYHITKANAQSVYDWYVFAVSLCKIPLLMAAFNLMYICSLRLRGESTSVVNIHFILDILLTVIIIRLAVYRINGITKIDKSGASEDAIRVRAKIVDDEDEE